MPENEFEKQVQQIFGDMRLKPSEAVWSKVQERVSRGKKRRRLLVWLPAALLLLGGGMYWALDGNHSLKKDKQASEAVASAGNKTDAGDSGNASAQTDGPEKNSNPAALQPSPSATVPQNNSETKPEDKSVNTGEPVLPATAGAERPGIKTRAAANFNKSDELTNDKEVEKVATVKSSPVQKNTAPNKFNAGNTGLQKQSDDANISAEKDTDESAQPVLGAYQDVDGYGGLKNVDGEKELQGFVRENKPAIKLAKNKSWEWGVSGQAGVSMVGNGLSIFKNGLFEKAESLDYVQNLSPSVPNNSFLGSQGNYVAAAPPPASPVRAGIAWNAGAFGKWHIKEKLALSFGAEYNLYTTNREVGNIVNRQYFYGVNNGANGISADANARFGANYTGSDGANYTNRYHFVQVPLGIQWQLNKGIKLPIQLDAGLTLAYLVATNAVHYRGGVYYEDKSLFHKFQTGLYTGVSVKLFQHTQRPLYVGPMVQYNLSGLGKPSSGLKQNFIYAGLKLQWALWKN